MNECTSRGYWRLHGLRTCTFPLGGRALSPREFRVFSERLPSGLMTCAQASGALAQTVFPVGSSHHVEDSCPTPFLSSHRVPRMRFGCKLSDLSCLWPAAGTEKAGRQQHASAHRTGPVGLDHRAGTDQERQARDKCREQDAEGTGVGEGCCPKLDAAGGVSIGGQTPLSHVLTAAPSPDPQAGAATSHLPVPRLTAAGDTWGHLLPELNCISCISVTQSG